MANNEGQGGNQGGAATEGGSRPGAFTVEFGDENNRTITINALKLRVRGRFSIVSLHNREDVGGRDVGLAMAQMPTIPGLRMRIDPRAGTYRLYDPLEDDKRLLDKINSVVERAMAAGKGGKFTFVDAVEAKLNVDEMKSLVIDIAKLVAEKSAVVVGDGKLPEAAQIDRMPGLELFDPWNSSSRKPRYAKDAEAYYAGIERQLSN